MSVLSHLFNRSIDQSSPFIEDYLQRKVLTDAGEVVKYEKVDYSSLIASNGVVSNWSLDSLLSAGVDPSFPVRTGLVTRLDGVSSLNEFVSVADTILSDVGSAAPSGSSSDDVPSDLGSS